MSDKKDCLAEAVEFVREAKRKRSDAEKAEQLKRSSQKLVSDRVEEILQHDQKWQEMVQEETRLRGALHIDRLNVSKKTQSVNNFTNKLQAAYALLQKCHKDEKLHMAQFADLERRQELHRIRLGARIQRDFGLGNLTEGD